MNDTFQYFIYGIVVPYKKIKEIADEYRHQDDVHGLFRGRDGKFIILGKVLDEDRCFGSKQKPFKVPLLEDIDELIIRNQVKDNFGIEGNFDYYFVTK